MIGFARQQFEKLINVELKAGSSLLDQLKLSSSLQLIDLKAADFLTKGLDTTQNTYLLLAFLFAASRRGHLCIEVGTPIAPSIKSIWAIESSDDLKSLNKAFLKGFEELKNLSIEMSSSFKLIENKLYLEKSFVYERDIDEYFNKIEKDSPALKVDFQKNETSLNQLQAEAIKKSFESSISFITGGPGVGKTYTATFLIKEFLKQHPTSRVAIAAPTGKAVANLEQYLSKLSISSENAIESYTLHKLFYQKIYSFLPFDLIIIDESSMVDTHFMLQLLKYYKPHSRIIFLGDPHQLPPVGSGFVFGDLFIKSLYKTKLVECLRTEIKEIIECAEYVKNGQESLFLEKISQESVFFELDDKELVYKTILKKIPKFDLEDSLYNQLLKLQKYKILSPLRRGEFGVDSLNQKIRLKLATNIHPIMILSNEYSLELFNGDIGILIDQKEAIFFSRNLKEPFYEEIEKVRRIPVALLPSYELAYCISIHKSQGSEYDEVSIVIPKASEVFSRELLYTAITRSKKSFEIFSSKNTLGEIIKNQTSRLSGLNPSET